MCRPYLVHRLKWIVLDSSRRTDYFSIKFAGDGALCVGREVDGWDGRNEEKIYYGADSRARIESLDKFAHSKREILFSYSILLGSRDWWDRMFEILNGF